KGVFVAQVADAGPPRFLLLEALPSRTSSGFLRDERDGRVSPRVKPASGAAWSLGAHWPRCPVISAHHREMEEWTWRPRDTDISGGLPYHAQTMAKLRRQLAKYPADERAVLEARANRHGWTWTMQNAGKVLSER